VSESVRTRRTGRVLLVDRDDRLLLFRCIIFTEEFDRDSFWITVGGGLDDGESPATGAARELWEETGLRLTPAELGEPVAETGGPLLSLGEWIRGHDTFYLVRVDEHEVDTSGFDEGEAIVMPEHRWWTLDDLDATDELVLPVGVTGLLRGLLAGAITQTPVGLPWRPGSQV
jgi:8-oxo-dGTP pyrophosphatase MutT (NUDIX family)